MKKKSENIYDAILESILNGTYAAGEFLSEAQIAAKFEVSKAPVKDAMHLLSNEGFLVRYPMRGYMVNFYTVEDINNIQEVRQVLETLAIRKAIKTATDSELKELLFYHNQEEMQYTPSKTINTKFHMGIAKLAHNEALETALYPMLLKAAVYNITKKPDTKNFDKIVDAMLARNEELAVKYLLEDVRLL